ncbi:hypothetical protein [Kitasatospora sp. NPDC004289]
MRRGDRNQAGWVVDLGAGWGAFIDGRMVLDAADHTAIRLPTPQYAVQLLGAALLQELG